MQYAERDPFSVSELNALVRELVEEEFASVDVTGEISNYKLHTSGHIYFTLKDSASQLRVACFRSTARHLQVELEDGMKVVVRGRLTLYEKWGQYQLVAEEIREAGRGELEAAYRKLLKTLEAEGMFETRHKKPLPRFPLSIAIVTSPTGAAVRDMLSTLRRRWPCARVLVVPVHVQGELAAPEIVWALDHLSAREDIDVILLGRGGGSLEDLWAFNEEAVARAVFRCRIPVVSAVGHETDVTICDFVADVRAATPTMAAEISVPLIDEVLETLDRRLRWLSDTIDNRVRLARSRLQELLRSYALGRVRGTIEGHMQALDFAMEKLKGAVGALLSERSRALEHQLITLRALNPSEILSRGYTLCTEPDTGRLVQSAEAAQQLDEMSVRFSDGSVKTEVKERMHESKR